MTTEEKAPVITTEDLKNVGEWVKKIDLSTERKHFINENTQSVIAQMSFIDIESLKRPYTL